MNKTTKLEECSEWIGDKELKEGCWIHYKGHNIPKDVLLKELHEDWDGYIFWDEDCEDIIEILDTKEDYYYCTRYFEGDDAKDHGFNFWIEFRDNPKKTYGKSTNVFFKISKGKKYQEIGGIKK